MENKSRSLKNIFLLATIPQEARVRLAYDVYQAAVQAHGNGGNLDRISGPFKFDDLGNAYWKDTGHSNELPQPEKHDPTGSEFTISDFADFLDMPLDVLPLCLNELMDLGPGDLHDLIVAMEEKGSITWKDAGIGPSLPESNPWGEPPFTPPQA